VLSRAREELRIRIDDLDQWQVSDACPDCAAPDIAVDAAVYELE
jgi:hypothetical protein